MKHLNKKNAILITIAAIVIIAAMVLYFTNQKEANTKSSKSEPQVTITRKKSLLKKLIKFSTPVSDYLGGNKINNQILSGKSKIKGNVNLLNLKDSGKLLSKTSMDFTLQHNTPSKELAMDFSVDYGKKNALKKNCFMNSSNLFFKVPSNSDKVYSINFENADSSIISTGLFNSLSGDLSELTGHTDLISAYIYKIKENFRDDFHTILSGISITPAGPDSFNNSGFTIICDPSSVSTFLKDVLSISVKDDNFRKLITPMLYSYVSTHIQDFISADGLGDSDDIINDILYDIESSSATISSIYTDPLTFTVWIKSDGNISNLKSDNTVHINGNTINFIFNISTMNEENSFDHSNTSLAIIYNGSQFNLNYNHGLEYTDVANVSDSFAYSLNGTDYFKLNKSETLNPKDGSYKLNTTLSTDAGKNLTFATEGKLDNVKAGESFDFDVNNFYLNDGFDNLITLKGKLNVSTGFTDIKKITRSDKELTYMSEDEIKKLFGIK